MATGDTGADLNSIDRVNAVGRYRFLQLRGWLGGFIQEWVTDPAAVLMKIGEEMTASGKSRFARLQDGTILMQSVAE
ncbi:hypothetical protein, partial [Listeria monocytogenes]|uniref:hypothetical protein n=1 Tax=Listeria monocytogenes TaxID=1639 RepID=UPI002FDBE4F6